jgi:SAM-dependent methyltransferase
VSLLPRLTKSWARGDREAFERITRRGIGIMLAISIPLTVFIAVLAGPATQVLFHRGNFSRADAALLGLVIAVYSASLVGAGLQRVLLGTFLARLETKVLLRNTLYGSIAELALIMPLVTMFGRYAPHAVLAVPIAYAGAQMVNVGHAWARMRADLGISLKGLRHLWLRLAVASVAAAVAMVGIKDWFDISGSTSRLHEALVGAVVGIGGAIVLLVTAAALLRSELRSIWTKARRRRPVPQGQAVGRNGHGPSPTTAATTGDNGIGRGFRAGIGKVRRASAATRRLGLYGAFHLLHVVIEPVLIKPLPLYVRANEMLRELRRKRAARAELSRWRSRREEIVSLEGVELCRSEALCLEPDKLDRLREGADGHWSVAIAEIDQDGFLLSSVGALRDVPTVSSDRFAPRIRFDLAVMDVEGHLGVRKHFRGDVAAFVAELSAAHDLRGAGCRVPAILDVDFDRLTITFQYMPGRCLREELALHAPRVRDRGPTPGVRLGRLRARKRRRTRIEEGRAKLDRVVDGDTVERLFLDIKKAHAAGYVLHDIKYGNIILDNSRGQPYFVDLERARTYPGLGRLAFRLIRDRDHERFNRHFGTAKPTDRGIEWYKRRLHSSYAPFSLDGGHRFGAIWRTDAGQGRWRCILRDNLPAFRDARVLDLGANNGYNAIQMLREGAREVVAVEINDEAVAEGVIVRELFEWADNRAYPVSFVREDMARIVDLALGSFDLVTALCSIYYLEDDEIAALIRHIGRISPTLVLQCNTDRTVKRSNPRTYERASVEYALDALRTNGFPRLRVVAPRGYRLPIVIGHRPNDRSSDASGPPHE